MASPTYAERARSRMRDEVLDAAAATVGAGGWAGLRMQPIADRVGISRRTLYNEFGSKLQLAEALVLRTTRRILDDVQACLATATDLPGGWEASVRSALRTAREDPVLATVLDGTAGAVLPLLTSEGTPVIEHATERMIAGVLARWPELPARRVALAVEATVRLALSHIVRPGRGIDESARDITELAVGYLSS